ncbi:penicillin-binding transpeptidase domain-containing protein [Microcella alkalica]|uniref:Peptidoglycan glycosyltransferase n=1 Tax=Microcella alkalica TaxID=355930 RepID=A0A839E9Y2_9MICO|nr:penicillin-binding protein 2 [Microcella alkalica]MBA8848560.1 peptidoglycan glycosyltransferase [Microcella alkalica]
MNKELRRVSLVALAMFLALFVSTSVIQVFAVDGLRADGRNARTLFESYSAERGPILIDGAPIAESVPVDTQYEFLRTYLQPELYAAITGYFTLNQGNTGIEGELNDFLSGSANEQFLDQLGALVTGQRPRGAAVELTVDPVVQQAAWDALGDQQGSVVAIEPATGRILALVSKPAYDPNRLAAHDTQGVLAAYEELINSADDPLVNRAIAGDLYFPGSVFKVLMTAAAIDSGAFEPESEFPNPPSLELPNSSSVISNSEGGACGGGETVTLATALRLSCNIPFAQLGLELGEGTIADYAEAFGFGTRVEIPMRSTASTFPTGLDDAQLMLSSFGQYDVRVTPLQIAMISAAIANGGNLMQPTLVERVIAPDLSIVQEDEPVLLSQPVSRETASILTQLMVDGVANGAASNATIEGVAVAGKTGTAENGGETPFTLWFTGFAPADDPQVAIAVVVENGGGFGQTAFGNRVAAPIAKTVLEAVLNR